MNKKKDTECLQDKLHEVMSCEIRIMRELLGNLKDEQRLHLHNMTDKLKTLLQEREPLLESLEKERVHRVGLIEELAAAEGNEEERKKEESDDDLSLKLLLQFADSESCEILLLRDQMLALIDELKNHTEQNNYLIENKLKTTKELVRKLHPADPNTTYGAKGAKKVKTATSPIINQEV